MTVTLTPALQAYLKDKKKPVISVEVATSDRSDFDVTELFIRLVSEDFADYLIRKKNCRAVKSEDGHTVLLPNYRLEYETNVVFDIRKLWIFSKIVYTGIKL